MKGDARLAQPASRDMRAAIKNPGRGRDFYWSRPNVIGSGSFPASDRLGTGLAGTDADDLLDILHEDFAIADFAGTGRLHDGVHRVVQYIFGDHGFHLHFRQEIHHVLGATVKLGVPLLATEALDFGDGQAIDADGGERFADFVEFEWLDDGGDVLHGVSCSS